MSQPTISREVARRYLAIHHFLTPADGFVDGFAEAVEAHRAFGGVDRVTWPRTARHRPFVQAVLGNLP